MTAPVDVTLARLEDQIAWYDRRSGSNQRWFQSLKVVEIVAAAFIPFSAGFELSAWITAALGVVIIVAEGLQQLYQHHHNWITYRSTCEFLKHEKFLFLAKAGPYTTVEDTHALLAERVESLVSQEHAKWVSTREQAVRTKAPHNP